LNDKAASDEGGRLTYTGRSAWEKLELLFLDIGAGATFLLGLYVTVGVITRTFFASSIPDETVIVAELMIVAVVLPLAFVAAERGFIVVEIFVAAMARTARVNAVLNLLGSVCGVLSLILILYGAWNTLIDAYADGDYYFGVLSLPEWPGRLAFFLGYLVFFIRLAMLCWRDARDVAGRAGAG